MLSKAELRTKCTQANRRYRVIELEDGSKVRLQSLRRSEQRQWRKATQKADGSPDPAKIEFSNDILLAMVIVDEHGALVFTIGDALGGMFDFWDTQDTTRLVEAAIDHCGLVADVNEIKDAIKNLEATPGDNSSGVNANGSDSQSTSSTNDSTTSTN